MTNTVRKNIKIGAHVSVVEKHNQRSGKLTEGYVSRILTNSARHPWGIKVMLTSGKVGRVAKILLPKSKE
ncbi:MAG: YwbE family protein [Candidatus Lokiarchaeota archaeon]|nr:YwbE family protein [Candidatus Lokiarchaeota archaeon]